MYLYKILSGEHLYNYLTTTINQRLTIIYLYCLFAHRDYIYNVSSYDTPRRAHKKRRKTNVTATMTFRRS